MIAVRLGPRPLRAIYRGRQELWRFDPAALFIGDQAGHAAGGYAPAPFTPSLLFGSETAGHYGGGYEVSK